jgi:hypothetical protein
MSCEGVAVKVKCLEPVVLRHFDLQNIVIAIVTLDFKTHDLDVRRFADPPGALEMAVNRFGGEQGWGGEKRAAACSLQRGFRSTRDIVRGPA